MHHLISTLLQKRNLTTQQLTPEEHSEVARWQSILEDEVTVQKIEEFCRIQMDLIEAKWADLDGKKIRNERLVIMHATFKKILLMIKGKKTERVSVEAELNRLIDSID